MFKSINYKRGFYIVTLASLLFLTLATSQTRIYSAANLGNIEYEGQWKSECERRNILWGCNCNCQYRYDVNTPEQLAQAGQQYMKVMCKEQIPNVVTVCEPSINPGNSNTLVARFSPDNKLDFIYNSNVNTNDLVSESTGIFNLFNVFTGTGLIVYRDGSILLQATLTNIFSLVFILLAIVAVLFVFLGAFRMLTAQGNDESYQGGTSLIKNALIGFAIAAAAALIVSFAGNILGFYSNASLDAPFEDGGRPTGGLIFDLVNGLQDDLNN